MTRITIPDVQKVKTKAEQEVLPPALTQTRSPSPGNAGALIAALPTPGAPGWVQAAGAAARGAHGSPPSHETRAHPTQRSRNPTPTPLTPSGAFCRTRRVAELRGGAVRLPRVTQRPLGHSPPEGLPAPRRLTQVQGEVDGGGVLHAGQHALALPPGGVGLAVVVGEEGGAVPQVGLGGVAEVAGLGDAGDAGLHAVLLGRRPARVGGHHRGVEGGVDELGHAALRPPAPLLRALVHGGAAAAGQRQGRQRRQHQRQRPAPAAAHGGGARAEGAGGRRGLPGAAAQLRAADSRPAPAAGWAGPRRAAGRSRASCRGAGGRRGAGRELPPAAMARPGPAAGMRGGGDGGGRGGRGPAARRRPGGSGRGVRGWLQAPGPEPEGCC